MSVKELIGRLELEDPNATVWVDWDREGGNEEEVTRIEEFSSPWRASSSGDIVLR